MATSLSIPKTATAADLAAAFSLQGAWSSSDPTADVVSSASTNQTFLATLVGTRAASTLDPTFALLRSNWAATGSSAPNVAWTADPFDGANGADVLQVTYPSGTREGTQYSMQVFENYTSEWNQTVQTALIKYEVAFSDDFDYVLGGKLPGLYGANPESTQMCTGGKLSEDCLSARLMWRERGAGEVYAYLPTYSGFCSQSDVFCNEDYGISLSRGSFRFQPGSWSTVTQLVSLNTPGYANGLLYLYKDDELALAHTGLSWRTRNDVTLTTILFSTFFGGSGSEWNSKGGEAYFRRFEAYASPLASNTTGPAVNASSDGGWSASPPAHPPPALLLRLLPLSLFVLALLHAAT